jgi:hypothetical protein
MVVKQRDAEQCQREQDEIDGYTEELNGYRHCGVAGVHHRGCREQSCARW